MKTFFSLFVATFLCVSTMSADDASYVANWKLPIFTWFKAVMPADISAVVKATCVADSVSVDGFDPASSDFDAAWNAAGAASTFGGLIANPDQNAGAADFSPSYKVLYDEDFMYILVKATDDDITGLEAVEVMFAHDDKIQAVADKAASTGADPSHGYMRFTNFGGFKATFTAAGFSNCMMVSFDASGTGAINWGGTTPAYSANLLLDNKGATTGAGVIKWVITVGYPALAGEQRPIPATGIPAYIRALNGGKGISFDIKLVDRDANDPEKTVGDPSKGYLAAEYWYNAIHNDGYAATVYSGYLKPVAPSNTALNDIKTTANIFVSTSKTTFDLTETADVNIYSATGKQVMQLKNANKVDISGLSAGIYMLRANGQTLKVVR